MNFRRLVFILVGLAVALGAMAASVQKGYVKTRGRMDASGKVIPGKRVDNVLITLRGGNSVKSNAQGEFSMNVPSGVFYLADFGKEGYVVADPDVLAKKYVCSANPLALVLEVRSVQADDRLAVERRLRRRLQAQLQQREEEIEALKEQKKISDEQFRQQMQQLYDEQENNEKFIREMADRYSRIDFDLLDDFQARVAGMIQNGELARADSLLRTKGSMDEREAEIRLLREANARERAELSRREENLDKSEKSEAALLADFGADCYNHFEIDKLRFANDSAAYWIERRALADTTNIDWQLDAGAFIAEYRADYSRALSYYNRALTLALAQEGEPGPATAYAYNSLATVYVQMGDYDKARDYLTRALAIQVALQKENSRLSAAIYNNLGSVSAPLNDYDKALDCFVKSLNVRKELYGENHVDLAESYNNIGNVYLNRGEFEEALSYLDKALEIQLAVMDENHLDIAATYTNIGGIYHQQGDYDRSLEYYYAALSNLLKTVGENHPEVAKLYANIGGVMNEKDDKNKALDYYYMAAKILFDKFGENDFRIPIIYSKIGQIHYELGEGSPALTFFETALRILQECGEGEGQLAVDIHIYLGALNMAKAQFNKALENYCSALRIIESTEGENSPQINKLKELIKFLESKKETTPR